MNRKPEICWEVNWIPEVKIDPETGDSDFDRSTEYVERFCREQDARRFAEKVFPETVENGTGQVRVCRMQRDIYGEFQEVGTPAHFTGGPDGWDDTPPPPICDDTAFFRGRNQS